MLLPDGGGQDMLGATWGLEPNTIELLIDDRVVYIVKPKRLIFEGFDFDSEWNYFRLETADLEATGISDVYSNCEILIEVVPLHYINEIDWDRDRDEDRRYPSDSRRIHRYVNEVF
jgi:hypothetical protein